MLELINQLLQQIGPSQTAMLNWLQPRVGNYILAEIARADYGMGEIESLATLKLIRDTTRLPEPLAWEPHEVLSLSRWSEPDMEYGTTSIAADIYRGHLKRAFCCAILLQATTDYERYHCEDGDSTTLVIFLASAVKLGDEGIQAAMRFLGWIVSVPPPYEQIRPFYSMGLLLLTAARYKPGQDATDLRTLADWVLAEEERVRPITFEFSEHWLIGLDHGIRDEAWPVLARQVLADPTKPFPEPAAGVIRRIVELICDVGG